MSHKLAGKWNNPRVIIEGDISPDDMQVLFDYLKSVSWHPQSEDDQMAFMLLCDIMGFDMEEFGHSSKETDSSDV